MRSYGVSRAKNPWKSRYKNVTCKEAKPRWPWPSAQQRGLLGGGGMPPQSFSSFSGNQKLPESTADPHSLRVLIQYV